MGSRRVERRRRRRVVQEEGEEKIKRNMVGNSRVESAWVSISQSCLAGMLCSIAIINTQAAVTNFGPI